MAVGSVAPWNERIRDGYFAIRSLRHVFQLERQLRDYAPRCFAEQRFSTVLERLDPDSLLLPLFVPFAKNRARACDRLMHVRRSMLVAQTSKYFAVTRRRPTDESAFRLEAIDDDDFASVADVQPSADELRILTRAVRASADKSTFLRASLAAQSARIRDLELAVQRVYGIVRLEREVTELLRKIASLRADDGTESRALALQMQIRNAELLISAEREAERRQHRERVVALTTRRDELIRAIEQMSATVEQMSTISRAFTGHARSLHKLVIDTLADNVARAHESCLRREREYLDMKKHWPDALISRAEDTVRADSRLSSHERAEQIAKLRAYGERVARLKDSAKCGACSFPYTISCEDITELHVTFCEERTAIAETLKRSRWLDLTKSSRDRSVAFVTPAEHARIIETERLIAFLFTHGTRGFTNSVLRTYNVGRPFDMSIMAQQAAVHLDDVNSHLVRDVALIQARFGLVPNEIGKFLVALFAARYHDSYDSTRYGIVEYMDARSRLHRSTEQLNLADK